MFKGIGKNDGVLHPVSEWNGTFAGLAQNYWLSIIFNLHKNWWGKGRDFFKLAGHNTVVQKNLRMPHLQCRNSGHFGWFPRLFYPPPKCTSPNPGEARWPWPPKCGCARAHCLVRFRGIFFGWWVKMLWNLVEVIIYMCDVYILYIFYSILVYSIILCFILFYAILFYSILFCSIILRYILFYSILFCSIILRYILFYAILFYSIILRYIMFYSILLYYTILDFILFYIWFVYFWSQFLREAFEFQKNSRVSNEHAPSPELILADT